MQKILLSILKGNSNITSIKDDSGFHKKTLSKYLPVLAKQHLIEQKNKDWKRGKSKFFSLTAKGIQWLVNNPLNETLELLTEVVVQLSNPKFRDAFHKATNEHDLRNTKLIRNYFIERLLKRETSFNPPEFDRTDFDQPFREALKKILRLHLYLISYPYQKPEEVDKWLEKNCLLFWPNVRFAFGWHEGAFPKLEQAVFETDQFLKQESRKLENQSVQNETHLMGLDFVEEEYFERYVKASSLRQRRKIMAEIENEAGWAVSKYTKKLFKGKNAEIEKYVDRSKRPYLREFIDLLCSRK
jgi:predicted transcriptional regulator